jgi:hypothetical protein
MLPVLQSTKIIHIQFVNVHFRRDHPQRLDAASEYATDDFGTGTRSINIGLAHELGLRVPTEGVQEYASLELLRSSESISERWCGRR